MSEANITYLDPEIANEGDAADAWQPFVAKPAIPNYDGITSIKKYFPEKSGIPYKHQAYPAWLYHPTDPPVLVRNAEHAAKLGVTWRDSTADERASGWAAQRWEFTPGSWRPTPYVTKFDPLHPDTGKEVVLTPRSGPSQGEMIAGIVAAVMAQIGAQNNGQSAGNALAAPTNLDTDFDYVEFQAFKRWKHARGDETGGEILAPHEKKKLLLDAAKSRGIEVDGRWSIERITEELEKVVV